jgi:hypothetical protein
MMRGHHIEPYLGSLGFLFLYIKITVNLDGYLALNNEQMVRTVIWQLYQIS